MNEEEIRKMIDGLYDESKEDTLRSMIADFYSRKMMSFAIIIWVYGVAFGILAVYSAVKFFSAADTKGQIMFAALFLCAVQIIALCKIFAWQMIHRNGIKREIKRLEIRIANLTNKIPGEKKE